MRPLVPAAAPPPCPHDLGPGTTVCLRCRQEQRELARATQRRLMLRSGIALAGLVVVAVISNSALSALRARRPSDVNQPVKLLASTSSSTVRQQGEAIA